MVSYRFLRPDDMPLIADSVNRCYNVHFPATADLDLEGIKKEARELNLWASSCMAALEGTEPVAILAGAKREGKTLVLRIGVRQDYQGQGHGSHLLQSLSAKLAIIGPPHLLAELPADNPRLSRFFERAGFRKDKILVDFSLNRPLEPIPETPAIQPVPLEDLLGFPDLWQHEAEAWGRAVETLVNRKESMKTLALLSPEKIEAFLAYRPDPERQGAEIWRFGYQDSERGPLFITLLLRDLCRRQSLPLYVPKLNERELSATTLTDLGFQPGKKYATYRAVASS